MGQVLLPIRCIEWSRLRAIATDFNVSDIKLHGALAARVSHTGHCRSGHLKEIFTATKMFSNLTMPIVIVQADL